MENTNEMMLEFDSRSCNEGFARVAVAAFCTQLNPTLEEVADIKTAVSEAITNAVIHGYENQVRKIRIECRIVGQDLYVTVDRSRKGDSGRQKGHGTSVHYQAGTGPLRHGICLYGGFYG